MATKKQEISKHKTGIARQAARSSAKSDISQVFDIVPRSRVRANHTSRPVITANKPEVADNILATAPTLGVKRHGATVVSPVSSGQDAGVPAEKPETAPEPPKEKGVSVADLLAKRAAVQTAPEIDKSAASTASAVTETVEDEPKTEQNEEVEVGTAIDLSSVAEESDNTRKPEGGVKDEGANASDAAADGNTPTEDVPRPEEAAEKPVETNIDNDEALARALQGSASVTQPLEHSEALKEEIKNLGKDGREHHELYGGKPVIVVHKAHKTNAVFVWVLWFLFCLLVALIIVDVLLDAGIVATNYDVPYTDFIKE